MDIDNGYAESLMPAEINVESLISMALSAFTEETNSASSVFLEGTLEQLLDQGQDTLISNLLTTLASLGETGIVSKLVETLTELTEHAIVWSSLFGDPDFARMELFMVPFVLGAGRDIDKKNRVRELSWSDFNADTVASMQQLLLTHGLVSKETCVVIAPEWFTMESFPDRWSVRRQYLQSMVSMAQGVQRPQGEPFTPRNDMAETLAGRAIKTRWRTCNAGPFTRFLMFAVFSPLPDDIHDRPVSDNHVADYGYLLNQNPVRPSELMHEGNNHDDGMAYYEALSAWAKGMQAVIHRVSTDIEFCAIGVPGKFNAVLPQGYHLNNSVTLSVAISQAMQNKMAGVGEALVSIGFFKHHDDTLVDVGAQDELVAINNDLELRIAILNESTVSTCILEPGESILETISVINTVFNKIGIQGKNVLLNTNIHNDVRCMICHEPVFKGFNGEFIHADAATEVGRAAHAAHDNKMLH